MKKSRTVVYITLVFVTCIGVKLRLERKLHTFARSDIALPVVDATYYGRSLKRYSFGFDQLISDLIWVQLLQSASTSELKEGKVSWEYAQLEAITTLDPRFLRAYSFGASFLSVFRRDRLGAKYILTKWVDREPRFWRAHYVLGYHLFYEMDDYKGAYPHILRAAELPSAPDWLTSLGVRVLSQSGALSNALKLSLELYPGLKDGGGKDRLKQQIRSLHFGLRKSEWESALSAYREQVHREPGDIESLRSRLPRQIASLDDESELDDEIKEMLREKFEFYYDAASKKIASRKSEKELGLVERGIHYNGGKK